MRAKNATDPEANNTTRQAGEEYPGMGTLAFHLSFDVTRGTQYAVNSRARRANALIRLAVDELTGAEL